MTTNLFAHSRSGQAEGTWEPLEKHLNDVGSLAAQFASAFDSAATAEIAGLMHDLGKAKPGFQAYLRGLSSTEPHSSAGGKFCIDKYAGPLGQILAFCIAGHHAGLANGVTEGPKLTPLLERMRREPSPIVPNWLVIPDTPVGAPGPFRKPFTTTGGTNEQAFAKAFFIRMIFSCLVDADFLATETFYAEADGRDIERGWTGQLGDLKAKLDRHMESFEGAKTDVDRLRAEVLATARERASQAPGLFTLTVPTGGGKTLASLSFALDHALSHGLRRVVYVIPFTSIIDQTAAVFRDALADDDAILEHHSSFDWEGFSLRAREKIDDEGEDGIGKLQLAAQNWDRPIIVTTAVQFFESLFANRTSRCRKLHNLANAVIVLDEAQTLPLTLLRPCLAALRELARGYGSSVVLCTATQPAILKEDGFKPSEALSRSCTVLPVREIAPDPQRLYRSLRRVRVENAGLLEDTVLQQRLSAHDQVLCIVNTRTHARELFDALRAAGLNGVCHLSTAMTAAHRRASLQKIRSELSAAKTVRLVTTSLVEAGVDISFPVAYRAAAGIDSIAQAAGRCNRNGELGPDGGRLYVFDPGNAQGRRPPPELKQFAATAFATWKPGTDPLSLEAVREYFAELFWRRGDDQLDGVEVAGARGVMRALRDYHQRLEFPFESIAQGFRVIETTMVPIIIPASPKFAFGATQDLIRALRIADRPGGLGQKLQQFLVNVPPKARTELIAAGAAEVIREKEFGDQFVVLTNTALYHSDRGLNWGDPTSRDADSLVF